MHIKKYFSGNYEQNLSYWLLFLTVIITVLIRFHFLEIPFERDEGSYAYLGQQVLNGKVPYVDFFERKFPVIFYAYAAIVALFGYSLTGVHLGFLVINVISIIVVFLIVKKLFNPLTAWIAASAFTLYSMSPYASGFTAQSEHLVIFFLLLGIWAMVHACDNGKAWLYIASGVTMSLGLLVKQNGIFFIVFSVIALITWLVKQRLSTSQIFKYIIFYAIGGVFPLALVAFVLWLQGAFEEMIYWTIYSSADYISGSGLDKAFANITYMLKRISQTHLLIWATSLMGLISFWFLRKPLHIKILLTLFVLLSFVSVAPGFRFFGHYWLFIYPAMALLSAMLFYALSIIIRKSKIPLLMAFLLIFAMNIFQNADYYFTDDVNQPVKNTYGSDLFPATKKLSDYLNQQMQKRDQLLVLGFEPQIYVYTHKEAPVRFHFMKLLTKIENKQLYEEYKNAMLEKLNVNPPDYIVYMANYMNKDYAKDLKSELKPLLKKYEQIALVELRKWKETRFFFNEGRSTIKHGKNYISILSKKSEL